MQDDPHEVFQKDFCILIPIRLPRQVTPPKMFEWRGADPDGAATTADPPILSARDQPPWGEVAGQLIREIDHDSIHAGPISATTPQGRQEHGQPGPTGSAPEALWILEFSQERLQFIFR